MGAGKGGNYNHPADQSEFHLQAVTGKIPPSWSPERARSYSLRTYERDLILWAASTDLDAHRIGPIVALRLAGSAKVLAREMDIGVLQNGIDIPGPGGQGQVHINGTEFLLRQLKRRYNPLDQEVQITAISDIFHFKKHPHETTDVVLSRFELVLNEAENNGHVQFEEVLKSWMLLNVLNLPRSTWPMILSPTQGALPQNAAEYNLFVAYIRRNGHLWEEQKGIQQSFWVHGDAFGTDYVDDHHHASTTQYFQDGQTSWNHDYGNYAASDTTFTELQFADDDDGSSGQSNDDEAVDFSNYAAMTKAEAGEAIYLEYRSSKRRFRKFTGRPGRGRGKGKGKGKGKHGKSKGKTYYVWDESVYNYVEIHADDSYNDLAYAFQKGAGGKGSKGPRRNPIGPDGKVMTCSICGAEDHFQRFCSKGKGKGKGTGAAGYIATPMPSSSSTSSSAATVHWSKDYSAMPGIGGYFIKDQATPSSTEFKATIEYDDGSIEQLNSGADNALRAAAMFSSIEEQLGTFEEVHVQQFQDLPSSQQSLWMMPWWPSVYHTQVRLRSGQEGLLCDCGAITDLCGDRTAARIESQANEAGQGTRWSKIPAVTVEGVGKEADTIDDQAILPICLEDGTQSTYKAMVAKNSDLPALYGLNRMTEQQAVVDTGNDRLIYPGPGGIKYQLSPGSKVYKLQRAMSGHLLLPCSEWKKAAGKGQR